MRTLYLLLLSAFVGQCYNASAQDGCINPAQIDPNAICFQLWDPVCGCDNNTYSNECYAFYAGVTSWTPGECGSIVIEPCTDLGDVDFGPCEMVLGVGVLNGTCQSISGCGPMVGNVDYSPALYDNMEACQACLAIEAEPCTDLNGVDFGDCDLFMGMGVINGTCQGISGCGPVVDGIDYTPSIYPTSEQCEACLVTLAEPCTDLASVDFGMCAMPLGIGIVNNECVFISGCGWIVDGIDYTPSLYQTFDQCTACVTGMGDAPKPFAPAYPNPTNDRWNLELGSTAADLHITDLSGRVLWSQRGATGRVLIDAQQFLPGTYVLSISADGRFGHGRLVKE